MSWDAGGAAPSGPPYGAPGAALPTMRRYPLVLPVRGRRPPLLVFLVLIGLLLGITVWQWVRYGPTAPVNPDLSSRVWVGELISAGIVVVVVVIGRWSRSVGLVPRRGSDPAVPIIALVLCAAGAAAILAAGLDLRWGATTYVVVLVNALAIGVFEETMFRGLLWASLPVRWSASRVLLVTSIAFGALHLANGFSTGAWGTAAIQACVVSVVGLGLGAVRMRAGWLGLCVLVHAFIDGGLASANQAVMAALDADPAGRHAPPFVVLTELGLLCLYITLGITGIVVLVRTFRAERQMRALVARFPQLSGVVPESR